MSEISDLNEQLSLLILRCANANKSSLPELYGLTAPKLHAVQVRILGKSSMAERALHDTYSRVWLKAHQFDAKNGNAMAWLTSIARNHALNLRRATADTTQSIEHDDTRELSAERADIALLVNNPATAPMLSALSELDEKTRVSILTAYLDGLSWKELGVVYNAPVDSVRESIHKGMLTLRGKLHAPVR